MDGSKGAIETPALGVSLKAQYARGREFVFQTHVAQEIAGTDLDALLDKLNGSADRAEAFYAQDQARRQLEVEEKALENIVRRLGEVEANIQIKAAADNRRNARPSPQDEVAKKQALDSVEESKRRVAECKKYLAELIKKAGNRDGASSPANR
jgi:hypothetical protein